VHRHEQLALFDRAFDLFWQPHSAEGLRDLSFGQLLRQRRERTQTKVRAEKPGQDEGADREVREEVVIDKIYTYSDTEVLRYKDFGALEDDELAAVKRLMLDMSWNIEPRRTRRTVSTRHGAQIDLRRSLRQSLRLGGEV
ncbi:MAG TPA: hypothetical protein PKE45_08830, partial [Caldilineaceae bacterium]|nr:hypothetical protein [Caldilineaceae bacterium]